MLGGLQYQATRARRRHEPCEKFHRREFIDHQIKHYIRACGMRALVVVTDGKGAFVRSARYPENVANALRIEYGSGLALARVWWGSPEEITALQLAWSATSQRLDATIRGLLAAALNHEITLVPDHVVRSRACDFIERVNLEFEHLCRSGGMRELTQAFMAARRRRPSLQFDEFKRKFKLRILYAIAKELNT
jgi:hypothetical protein